MSVVLFFGKKHLVGETQNGSLTFRGAHSSKVETYIFRTSSEFRFYPLNPTYLQQVMVKTFPLIPKLEQDLHSRILIVGGYCRSGTGT